MKHDRLRYLDRRTGQVRSDRIYANRFLDWCYNTRTGWMLTRHILSRPFVSRLYGWYYKRPGSRHKIPAFVNELQIDLTDFPQPLAEYKSFNDFIIRRLEPSARPIHSDEATCISPADARVWVEPSVELDKTFRIKSALFQLGSFLRDPSLAQAYDAGTLFVFRLYLDDYHHFHFPDSGVPSRVRSLSGRYHAVTPYSRRWFVPYFAENHRQLTLFDSAHFGRVVMAEVGAFTVGSIRQSYKAGEFVAKGAHKGYFELGGSIVVLLFLPGRIEVDADLLANSGKGMETYVRMGETIGRVLR